MTTNTITNSLYLPKKNNEFQKKQLRANKFLPTFSHFSQFPLFCALAKENHQTMFQNVELVNIIHKYFCIFIIPSQNI